MSRHTPVLAASSASLPDDFRILSTTPTLIKSLSKLSRTSLVDLVFQWLDDKNLQTCRPYLASALGSDTDRPVYGDSDTNPYLAENSVEDLRRVYQDFRDRKGGKREVIDRILEGDWRHGISLRQLAMLQFKYIQDNPVGYRWTALRLVPITDSNHDNDHNDETSIPRFAAGTFVRRIQREISSLVKAHYHIHRSQTLPLTFVRILILDSPYQYPRQLSQVYTDSSRIICLAFPDSTPYVYSSLLALPGAPGNPNSNTASSGGTTTDTRTLRRLVMDAIPKALSRPQLRYLLRQTSLTAKSLHTLLTLRGPWRSKSANGAFTIFADAVAEGDPLDARLPQFVAPKVGGKKIMGLQKPGDHDQSFAVFEPEKENTLDSGRVDSKHAKTKGSGKRPLGLSDRESASASKKRRIAVLSRFGTTAQPLASPAPPPDASDDAAASDGPATEPRQIHSSAPLDRLQIHLKDPPYPGPDATGDAAESAQADADADDDDLQSASPTTMSLTFSGTDVIAGLRQLAELGVIDPERMPSWMTGEEGVSSAAVRRGKRIRSSST
jgi:central kinetochore subunit Mis15/CHL4